MKLLRTGAGIIGGVIFLWLLLHGTDFVVQLLVGFADSRTSGESHLLRYLSGIVGVLSTCAVPAFFLWQRGSGHRGFSVSAALLVAETAILMVIAAVPRQSSRFCTTCDYTVGGINLFANPMTDEQLTREFGPGCKVQDAGWGEARSYYFPGASTVMLIKSNRVKIFRSAEYSPKCKATRELNAYATGKGVGLGDTEQKIVDLYGRPSERYAPVPATPELIYRMPGKAMSFLLSDGKVKSIEIQL